MHETYNIIICTHISDNNIIVRNFIIAERSSPDTM